MNTSQMDYFGKSRKQILNRTIWAAAIACIAFGVFNLNLSSWPSAIVIFSSAIVCLAALVVNQRNYQTLASFMVCISVLITITFSLLDGDGLLDPGIVGYPLFILLGTLLLNKRYTFWLTLASILALSLVAFMQVNGYLHLTIHENQIDNFLVISIFLVVGAVIVWVILESMEKHLMQIRASEAELRHSYDLTIQVLSNALDIRDVDTGNHTHRVVELTEKLARELNLSGPLIHSMRYGAYLHDIGKMGVPDEILLKKGPLTPEEWEIMRSHPLKAVEMLRNIPYLQPALDIPKYHHERWDGAGYPYHLAGAQIPLAARIFAVVDVWDALTNERPYRNAWSHAKARSYILEQSGIQFDPAAVEVFLKVIDRKS